MIRRIMVRFLCFVFLTGVAIFAYSQSKPTTSKGASPASELAALADRYFEECYFKFNPSQGTQAGFHQYDDQLEDYSRAAIEKQIATLKKFKAEFSRLTPSTAPNGAGVEDWIDRNLILNDINSTLLSLENIRGWEKNPDRYSSGITNSIFVIMART